ncbi:MAG: ECF transporter S component [Bifidobacterium mongoliense]
MNPSIPSPISSSPTSSSTPSGSSSSAPSPSSPRRSLLVRDGARRFRWTPADIAVAAALGVACGMVFWGFNFAYQAISPILGAILPGIASVLHAFWYFSGPLALLIIRKPGAALFVNLVGTFAEMLLGNQFSFGFVIVSALLQGVFAEIPFAIARYRRYSLPLTMAAGALTALEYGVYLMFFVYQGVAILSPRGVIHMISELVGGILFAGVMSWFLFLAIARTGALDRFASGRAVRRAVEQS